MSNEDNKEEACTEYSFKQIQDLIVKHAQVVIDYEIISDFTCDFTPVLTATRELRKLLSIEGSPPIGEVVSTGVSPVLLRLISLLYDTQHEFVFEATWALTNICSGACEYMTNALDNGLVEVMIHVLQHPDLNAREQAVWCIANIAGNDSKFRDLVVQAEFAVDRILEMFLPQVKLSTCRNLTWLVSNLCRGKPPPDFQVVSRFIPTLSQLLYNVKDDCVTVDALWALSYLCDGSHVNIQAVIVSGAMPLVVAAVNNMQLPKDARAAALRTVGNLCTGTVAQTQFMIDLGAIDVLHTLLTTQAEKKNMVKEAMWVLSNIAAGTESQVNAILKCNGLIPLMIDIACHTKKVELIKEVMYALSNMTSVDASVVHELFQQYPHVLFALLYGLKFNNTGVNEVAYIGIENLIEKVGMEKLFKCIKREIFDLDLLNNNTHGDSVFVGLAANPTYCSNVNVVNLLIGMNVEPSIPSLRAEMKTGYRFVIEEYNAVEYCERFQQVKTLTLFCAMQTVPRLKHHVVKLPMELWRMLQTMLFVIGPIHTERI